MFVNPLEIAFRYISENRVHSVINILGLALGLAGCILLFLRFELSYDQQFTNADRIYQISREYFPLDGASGLPANTHLDFSGWLFLNALPPAFGADFLQIENGVSEE